MPRDFPTDDEIDKMHHQHLKDEFDKNKESIVEKREAFKKQLHEARTGQYQQAPEEQKQQNQKAANDNQNGTGVNDAHNTGQGKSDATDIAKEKEKFKQQLQEARQGQQQQRNDLQANKEDITGDRAKKTADFNANAEDVTTKKPEAKDNVSKASPKPTPNPGFTRTWGPDRD